MARKTALFGGRTVKVENRSSFDKSFLNMLTTGVGTITPIVRQLVIPSSGHVKIPVHVELPPLATDAYIRSHLKMEAFFVPLRLCYGGFQSWFSGEPVYDDESRTFTRAYLPYGFIPSRGVERNPADPEHPSTFDCESALPTLCGVSTLSDYFDLRFSPGANQASDEISVPEWNNLQLTSWDMYGISVNIFPYIAYHLCYDHYYRNKSVTRPGFVPQALSRVGVADKVDNACHLPFVASSSHYPLGVILGSDLKTSEGDPLHLYIDGADLDEVSGDGLLNGHHLYELRQRNYGDDYFTAAKPTAQGSSPVSVTVSDNKFTISALRAANAFTEFSENQNYATPDYVQANMARYGVAPSFGIVQKPVCLASADFPIYTKSVELNSNLSAEVGTRNPFNANGLLGAKAGVASGNGTFEFDFDVKECGYIMVMATFVPEANYSSGIAKEMRILIGGDESAIPDLPCGLLEHIGDEPIYQWELNPLEVSSSSVFGYVQRYLWHKSGNVNQIHGLFREGQSLGAFAPQRNFNDALEISSSFLQIEKTDLDDVASMSSGVSEYGVMLDCAVEMFVSEPLTESALPALVNPASEHGKSVYLINGGSPIA